MTMKHPREHVMQKCTCIESAEMISALNRRASSTDSFVLPVPVDPSITIKGSFLNIIFYYLSLHVNFFTAKYFYASKTR